MRHFEKKQLNIQLHVIMPILIDKYYLSILNFLICPGSTYQLLRAFRSMIFMKLEDFQAYTGAFFYRKKA